MSAISDVWYGDDPVSSVLRSALTPASWVYLAGVRLRERQLARAGEIGRQPVLPALGVGNLTVGGTGKTPIAAWAAHALRAQGARPAVIMRGYGDDEPLVHARLNPDVPVIVDADRLRGAEHARAAGADCVILDDAFQHRRIARVSNWVLVAAERWRDDLRLLPAGPLREPVEALARADVLIVTRKSASRAGAEDIGERLLRRFPQLALAVCHLAPSAIVDARTGEQRPLRWIADKRVVAVAAVGDPNAFFAQLSDAGARVKARPFRDHHVFGAVDVRALAAAANERDGLICTLKDAVKLAPRWPPAAAPLWYVSQNAVIERGASELDHALAAVLAARQPATSTAG